MVRAASAGVSGKGQEVMASAVATVPHGSVALGAPPFLFGCQYLITLPFNELIFLKHKPWL